MIIILTLVLVFVAMFSFYVGLTVGENNSDNYHQRKSGELNTEITVKDFKIGLLKSQVDLLRSLMSDYGNEAIIVSGGNPAKLCKKKNWLNKKK